MNELVHIRRALVSVSDKNNIGYLCRLLIARWSVRIVSTGGTAVLLRRAELPVTSVEEVTGFPEVMDGRLKTLHPKIHGGILGRRNVDEAVMAEHGIEPLDLVVVNLYPFDAVAERNSTSYVGCIEAIDVGGAAMIRGAAKNHRHVTVVVDPRHYPTLVAQLEAHQGCTTLAFRKKLAAAAFAYTAELDVAIARWFAAVSVGQS